jgi:hypothetical protein
MLRSLVDFLLGRKKVAEPQPEAPYKVEAPVAPEPAKCGCGRSQSGLCVGLHKLTPEEWATHKDNPSATKPAPKKKRTFVKRQDSGVAKVAAVKAKPKAPAKPKKPAK